MMFLRHFRAGWSASPAWASTVVGWATKQSTLKTWMPAMASSTWGKAATLRSMHLESSHSISSLPTRNTKLSPQPMSSTTLYTPATPLEIARRPMSLSALEYRAVADHWMDSLEECFETVLEAHDRANDFDIVAADGVITLSLAELGTFVINKQTPNKQIWLSSPISGPTRYDWDEDKMAWVYSHDNVALCERLNEELSALLKTEVDVTEYTRPDGL